MKEILKMENHKKTNDKTKTTRCKPHTTVKYESNKEEIQDNSQREGGEKEK